MGSSSSECRQLEKKIAKYGPTEGVCHYILKQIILYSSSFSILLDDVHVHISSQRPREVYFVLRKSLTPLRDFKQKQPSAFRQVSCP